MKKPSTLSRRMIVVVLMLAIVGQACTFSLLENPFTTGTSTQTPGAAVPSATPQAMAQTNFVVILPEPLQANETLVIAVMDEVTGLAFSSLQYPMSARDSLTYTAVLPLPFNSVVKYRYIRRGAAQVLEDTSLGSEIRYRMFYVAGPSEIQDVISDWGDRAYVRPIGSILGQVFNTDTGSPLANMLVTAAGVQQFTDSSGRFELVGLPTGTQTLLVYSPDGLYQPFQQGAMVAENNATVVNLRVKQRLPFLLFRFVF